MDDFIAIFATFGSVIMGVLFLVYLKNILIDLPNYEKQINRLCKEKRKKIKIDKEPPAFSCSLGLELEIEDYDSQIEELERKRRFLLDKIPFLKK